jgi:hypothetical protein
MLSRPTTIPRSQWAVGAEDQRTCEKSSSHGYYYSCFQQWNNTSLGQKSVHTNLYIRRLLSESCTFAIPQTTMSRTRNRKGENSRRRKRSLLKKAYEYGELSGADIAFFIYQSGR